MATENIRDRKIYRILVDEVNKVWDRLNFLTNARSVDADDGENLETKVGAIKGITTSTTVTENGWAADAKSMNNRINELKKSVADYKNAIASALTSQGVHTSSDATFQQIINSINSLATLKYQQGMGAAQFDLTITAESRAMALRTTGGTRHAYAQPKITATFHINSDKTVTLINSNGEKNDDPGSIATNQSEWIDINVNGVNARASWEVWT